MLGIEMIERLWKLGHFNNPEQPTEVQKSDLPKLRLHDTAVKSAIKSYMGFFAGDMERLAVKYHARRAVIDGDPGPAFRELMEQPRCEYPDFFVPENALCAGPEEANWPTACRGKLKFGRSFKAAPGLNEADTDKAFWAAVNNWTYAIEDMDVVSDSAGPRNGSHQVYADLASLGGGTLAWSYLAQNSCSVWLQQKYNSRTNWRIDYLATVAAHEQGHAWGMPHNRDPDALLYPMIHSRSVARRGFPNQTDLGQMRGLGYKLSGAAPPKLEDLYRPRPHDGPTDPEDPDEPDPPTDPKRPKYYFVGDELYVDGEPTGAEFMFANKIKV